MAEAPTGPDGLETMAFQLLLYKVTSLEHAMQAIPPLLTKIVDQLEAQAKQPDVPVATYAQLYPELHEGASEAEEVLDVVAETPPPRRDGVGAGSVATFPQVRRRRFLGWFLKEIP
jgi:hypothetical protein